MVTAHMQKNGMLLLLDTGGCAHPISRVLQAMYFAENVYYTTSGAIP